MFFFLIYRASCDYSWLLFDFLIGFIIKLNLNRNVKNSRLERWQSSDTGGQKKLQWFIIAGQPWLYSLVYCIDQENTLSHLDMIAQLPVSLETFSTTFPFTLNGTGTRNGREADFLRVWKREDGFFWMGDFSFWTTWFITSVRWGFYDVADSFLRSFCRVFTVVFIIV